MISTKDHHQYARGEADTAHKERKTTGYNDIATKWQTQRAAWLKAQAKQEGPSQSESRCPLPRDTQIRAAIVETMKDSTGPYKRFDKYFRLDSVIRQYKEIWDQESDDEE